MRPTKVSEALANMTSHSVLFGSNAENAVGYGLSWSVELSTKRVYGVSCRKAYLSRYYPNGNGETPVVSDYMSPIFCRGVRLEHVLISVSCWGKISASSLNLTRLASKSKQAV